MANEVPAPVVFDNDLREQAAQNTLAANPLVGVRLEDILDSARLLVGQMLSSPGVAAQEYLSPPWRAWPYCDGRVRTGSRCQGQAFCRLRVERQCYLPRACPMLSRLGRCPQPIRR